MRQLIGDNDTEPERRGFSLWDRIIRLLEQELAWRRSRKLFVTLKGESGPYQKEIGELSALERRSLAPALREHVAEQLIERYLAEHGSVDLFEKRHAYTKHIRDLAPTDLPALIEAERHRVEEHQEECERAEFAEVVCSDLERLQLVPGTD
jgi:DNA-binding MarR family transcriptional regulator